MSKVQVFLSQPQELLDRLTVGVTEAALTTVPADWGGVEFVSEFHRLYLILSGTGFVRVNDQEHFPRKGDLVFLPAQARICFGSLASDPFHKYWCHFTCGLGDQDILGLHSLPVVSPASPVGWWETTFERLVISFAKSNLGDLVRTRARLLELLAGLLDNNSPPANSILPSGIEPRLRRVLVYIEENLAAHMSLEVLADQAHLHATYFVEFFRRQVQQTPMRYVAQRRMERAKMALRSPNSSIAEVADSVGIEDVSQFSKAFRAYTGLSPREYQKKNTANLRSDVLPLATT